MKIVTYTEIGPNGVLGDDALAWLIGAKSPYHQQTWTAE
jgi:hypothetical protein